MAVRNFFISYCWKNPATPDHGHGWTVITSESDHGPIAFNQKQIESMVATIKDKGILGFPDAVVVPINIIPLEA